MYNFKTAACLFLFSTLLPGATVDPALLGLVPPDTRVLVGVDVQTTGNSELAQVFLGRQNVDNKLQLFMEKTGFDPRRDLQYVLVASGGASRGAPNLVIARGVFDVERLTRAAVAKGGKLESIADVNVISMPGGNGSNALAFISSGVVVAGPPSLVRNAVSSHATPTVIDPALNRLISPVAGNEVWFASTAPLSSFPASTFPGQAAPLGKAQVAQSILQESGSVHFGQSIQFTFDALTRSPHDAQALQDVIRFLTSMLESKVQNTAPAALLSSALVQNLVTSVSGSDLQVHASMPEQVLEDFLASAGPLH